ncbi:MULTISPECIES: response regulator transcription factor [unclassified Actinomyces]|uniref:response regulator transcription factor n=1 Tax=unclassified Actinomyces TaxID=2609248 RepID=UPI00201706C3|nr:MULTISPECIES: response regulator transcription factor [unclassified Actinomyces]MCL3778150.1 response regulator transcription factor [Actinomyces sp. AC-20-1]MCL3789267.1 response regulator transcription factor [Actinomyces sp. 187325]MCL3791687.1 response regulator transcription factor [Actinomyces sp. 186855]MCL3794273.1 response regulator transcription factor [Actinomyces sp. 217892]
MRVLVVEDESYLAEAIAQGLRRESMAVDVRGDGLQALEAVSETDYDVVVLDRDLPGLHGDEVCARLVTDAPRTRVLMLTAARSLDERVEGFALGADDYLTKPFEFPELVARLLALGRRSQPARSPVLESHGVRLDPFRREVVRDSRQVRLSPKEFAVLQVLMEANGGVLSAETLLEKAWDANADPFTSSIRVTISHLRKRLGQPWVIQTVPGAGYRFGS